MTPNLCSKTAAPGNSLSIKVNLWKTGAFSCLSKTKTHAPSITQPYSNHKMKEQKVINVYKTYMHIIQSWEGGRRHGVLYWERIQDISFLYEKARNIRLS